MKIIQTEFINNHCIENFYKFNFNYNYTIIKFWWYKIFIIYLICTGYKSSAKILIKKKMIWNQNLYQWKKDHIKLITFIHLCRLFLKYTVIPYMNQF